MQYRSWLVVTWLARHLPLRISYAIAVGAGTIAYYGWPRGRKATTRNFRHVLGEDAREGEVRATARRSLVNYCKYLVDFARFPSEEAEKLVAMAHGDESFAGLGRALASGKGVVVACMHFGNWDLGAAAAAGRGFPVTVIVETFGDPRLDRLIVGARERLGMQIVRMERIGPSILRSLARPGVLALLADRPTPGDGVRVEFFGAPVELPAGPARLALRAGATMLPVAFRRIDPWRPDVEVLTDFGIEFESSGDTDADVAALTQLFVASHERFIRADPAQWYMFREMWPESTGG